ncbi:methyltransferase domain-containing protein [Gammaproteobacteria bacterium]|nr:methyltransferase domain-containing protein [Gammaproteobacteria bacterium]
MVCSTGEDRNFDDLTEKFSSKVYGGLKGDIRLAVIWRDLLAVIPTIKHSKPIRVLDIGGGLGQMSVRFAELGHCVTYNDLSANMTAAAKRSANTAGVEDAIVWHQCAYQDLDTQELGLFDLILCHAVLEWLGKPEELLSQLIRHSSCGAFISLTFYNHNALVYRNLIRGNFKMLESGFKADPGSLTPHSPFQPELVKNWSEKLGLKLIKSSGIRVFHDYVSTVRGGHENPQAVIDAELVYSQIEPFKWLGRYIHFVLAKKAEIQRGSSD